MEEKDSSLWNRAVNYINGIYVVDCKANQLEEAYKDFQSRFPNQIKLYFLSHPITGNPLKFNSPIQTLQFECLCPPPFKLLCDLCDAAEEWTQAGQMMIFCNDLEISSLGLILISLLLHFGMASSVEEGLKIFNEKNNKKLDDLVPSYRRYLHYFSESLKPDFNILHFSPLWHIKEVKTSFPITKGCKLIFGIKNNQKTLLFKNPIVNNDTLCYDCNGMILFGDTHLFLINDNTENVICIISLHSIFFKESLEFTEKDVDWIDKSIKSFKIELGFEMIPSSTENLDLDASIIQYLKHHTCPACDKSFESTQIFTLKNKPHHWSCVSCDFCSESLQHRSAATVNISFRGTAVACEKSDKVIKECHVCGKFMVSDFAIHLPHSEKDNGSICKACFRCSVCTKALNSGLEGNLQNWVAKEKAFYCNDHTPKLSQETPKKPLVLAQPIQTLEPSPAPSFRHRPSGINDINLKFKDETKVEYKANKTVPIIIEGSGMVSPGEYLIQFTPEDRKMWNQSEYEPKEPLNAEKELVTFVHASPIARDQLEKYCFSGGMMMLMYQTSLIIPQLKSKELEFLIPSENNKLLRKKKYDDWSSDSSLSRSKSFASGRKFKKGAVSYKGSVVQCQVQITKNNTNNRKRHCAKCSETIIDNMTSFELKLGALISNYHPEHFRCDNCRTLIPSSDVVMYENGKIFCGQCLKCKKCMNKIIGAYRFVRSFNKNNTKVFYHEECFLCHPCNKKIHVMDLFHVDLESKLMCNNCQQPK
eukprot:TRINITY_DN8598_c0_g1_i2.p1 TRINITY_DN8598_c0_g1~~TRINITY_DN8598_c0_g1_i2.p1  ORF type:complete len:760 (-),score=180.72 TRINITY_DN8598_c0_g1_i2:6-2285(-)